MSNSKKRSPYGLHVGESQKKGKALSHKRFRRSVKAKMQNGEYDSIPKEEAELTNSVDLGGDGKRCFSEAERAKMMRK